jgi:DNA-binding transcriptional LysR family regulator
MLRMRLHQLQAFVEAVEKGGIRSAARSMNISQAALTKAIRSLEDEAGAPLLTRSARGVTPTPFGQRFLTRARLVCRQFALCEEELSETTGGDIGEIRLGLTPLIVLSALGPAFARFRKRYPDIALRIVEGLVPRVLPLLRDASLDFAIVAESGDLSPREFDARRIAQESQSFAVRTGHPALRNPTADVLLNCEWGLPSPIRSGVNPGVDAMFERAGMGTPKRLLVGDTIVLTALAHRSDLVTILPSRMLGEPECAGLCALVVPGITPPGLDVRLVSRPDLPLTRTAAYLARCVVEALDSKQSESTQ